jgi:catechol 2,3-dioxygenase-like lactoylglutathione lyase family enzyme
MTYLVDRIGHVAFDVRDLAASVEDAELVLGLRVVERTGRMAALTSNESRCELAFYAADINATRRIGLEAPDTQAVDEATKRLKVAGARVLSEKPSLPFVARAVTFATEEGHVFEVHTPMPKDQPRRHAGPGIHPRRICHVNLCAEDPPAVYRLLNEALGMQVSERTAGNELMWIRGGDGRHHSVGCVKSHRGGLHHHAWEFSQFSDMMRLGDVLDALDRTMIWGPGRHGAGDNIFGYHYDAAGAIVETGMEMEVIENDDTYQTKIADIPPDLSNLKVVNRWGTPPPAAWIEHYFPFSPIAA